MKVAINTKIGGFHLSLEAVKKLLEYGHEEARIWANFFKEQSEKEDYPSDYYEESLSGYRPGGMSRANPILIRVIEELGPRANYVNHENIMSDIKIIEVPDDLIFYINESECGVESIHEVHRIWAWDSRINRQVQVDEDGEDIYE